MSNSTDALPSGRFVVLFHDLSGRTADGPSTRKLGTSSAAGSHPDSPTSPSAAAAPSLRDRGSHWDLLIQWQSHLESWSLASNPFDHPGKSLPAHALADHRLAYLDYQGPVSGDRGTVVQFEAGQAIWLKRCPAGRVVAVLWDDRRGELRLQPTAAGQWAVTLIEG